VVARYVLKMWVNALSPMIPPITEEVWSLMGNEGFVSLAKWPEIDESLIDEESEAKEEILKNLIEDISEVLKLLKEKPKTIKIFVASQWKRTLMTELKKMFEKGTVKFGDIMRNLMKKDEFRSRSREVQKIIQKVIKDRNLIPSIELSIEEEIKLYESARDFLQQETNCDVVILQEDEADAAQEKAKANQSLPLKPGLYFS